MMKRLAILAVLLAAANGWAVNFGKISGQVTDAETGQPLPGANVVVEGTTLGAAADINGYYVILMVPPGTWSVKADFIGYRSMRVQNVGVNTNRIAYANFQMSAAVLEGESVVVIAERPVVERDNTATMRSVDSEAIEQLPSTTIGDVLSAQAGMVTTGGLHLRGGRSGEITYMVDGVPMVNPLFSEISTAEVINRDVISEMQVISGTFSAEYGNAMSGIINIATKDGGDRFHMDLNVKSSSLGMEEASTDNNRQVARLSLGGPLGKRTNVYVSSNYDDRDSYLPWGYRTSGNVFAKLTNRSIKGLKFTAAANVSQGQHKSYSHSWKYIPDQYWAEPNTNSMMVQAGIVHTLRANLYYDLLVYMNSYHYDSGDYNYNDLSPAYQRDANKEFYLQSFVSSYQENDQTTMGVKGNMLWQANRFNEMKAGFEYRHHEIDRFYISSPYYDDHILDDYTVNPWEASAYIQDKINFNSIILSAGLRWDLTAPNAEYWANPYDVFDSTAVMSEADIHSQLSPRLGISYPVSEKTVFHFGYGHYFQRPEYQFIYKGLARNGSIGVTDLDGDGDVDYKDNVIMNLRSGNGRYGNPDLKPERTIAYEFGLSHQLFEEWLLNVSVYSKRITHLVGGRTFYAGDRPEYWETFSLHINEDFAYNNGLEVQLKRMRGKIWAGEVNYTYAVHEGSSSGPLQRVGVEEANRQSLKFFPLDFDQRHMINAFLRFRFDEGVGPRFLQHVSGSLLFRYGSGLPYTRGTRGATEPYEENNERLPANWTLDFKLQRKIDLGAVKITPYLEIYNLTDRQNVVYVDPYTGEPDESYGRTTEYAANPLNWGAPRLIYVGVMLGLN